MNLPADRRYTDQHEWVLIEEDGVRVGITDYAQDALGDVVYVDLPSVGGVVSAGETIAEVESTKSVAEVYAPVSGTIAEVNAALVGAPELTNADPYGAGWFVVLRPADIDAVMGLLEAEGYAAIIG